LKILESELLSNTQNTLIEEQNLLSEKGLCDAYALYKLVLSHSHDLVKLSYKGPFASHALSRTLSDQVKGVLVVDSQTTFRCCRGEDEINLICFELLFDPDQSVEIDES